MQIIQNQPMKPYQPPLKAAVFALCIALFACNAPTESTLPTSSGFSPEGGPVYFGSEASVQLVKDIDAAWAAEDMEQLEGPEAFIGRIMADTLELDWTFNWAYAVDAILDEIGDWVHAGFDVKSTQDSVLVEHAWFQEGYYIEGGKVLYWYNMKGTRPN